MDGTNAGDYDAFISSYNSAGVEQWTKQLGSVELDHSYGISADSSGNVYISGETQGDLASGNAGPSDAFVSKYNSAGVHQWTNQIGTADNDRSFGVAADDLGNVFIAGWTDGDMDGANAGGEDVFISKFNSSGVLQWTKQIGTSADDYNRGIVVDGLGNVVISGNTTGDLGGPNAGGHDLFATMLSTSGDLLWTTQFGSDASDFSRGITFGPSGALYFTGYTTGDLDGTNAGGSDAILTKIIVPEPSSLFLGFLALVVFFVFKGRK